jgi:hypothetical protein
MPANEKLTTLINTFSSTTTQHNGDRVTDLLNRDPEMMSVLNGAADANQVLGFKTAPSTIGMGAYFNPNDKYVYLPVDSNGNVLSGSDADSLFQLGHEISHAITDSDAAIADAAFTQGVQNLAATAGPHDYTQLEQAHNAANAKGEDTAQLAGWNAYVSLVNNSTPAGTTPNYTTSYYSKYFVDPTSGTPLPGLTFNSDMTIGQTSTNVTNEGNYYYYNNSVGIGTNRLTYSNFNGSLDLGYICAHDTSGQIQLNLSSVQMSAQNLALGGMNSKFTGACSLLDKGTNALDTFRSSSSGTTLDTTTVATDSNGSVKTTTSYGTNGAQTAVNVDVSGKETVSASGVDITLEPYSDAIISGMHDRLLLLDSAVGTITGSDIDARIMGDSSGLIMKGGTSIAAVYGNNDGVSDYEAYGSVTTYGTNDVTANYGDHAATYDDGSDEHNFNYGVDEWAYSANATDTNYNEYASDRGAGYGSYGYGGWGYGGGYHYGYYGYAGTVEAADANGGNKRPNIDALIAFDNAHGDFIEAKSASQAMAQMDLAISNHSMSVLSGATWKQQALTWNFSDDKGSSVSSLSSSEEKAIQAALDEWTAATGIKFKEVSSASSSDINFKWSDLHTQDSGVIGLTTIKRSPTTISHASIELENPDVVPLTTTANGQQVYAGTDASFDQVLLHEIGHALGFGDNVDPSSIENYSLTAANRTLSASDLAAAASLYGKGSMHGTSARSVIAGTDDLIQAMSSFAPVQMGNIAAANDVDDSTRQMYGTPMKYATA